jgi:hypothetical protein
MFPSRLVPVVVAFLVTLSLSSNLHAQRGAMTAPRNLAQLTDAAHVIVRGHVLSANYEAHPQFSNLKTVVVTLRVADTLKGSAPAVYTFRQFIWDVRDQFNTAGYRPGQELVLLLTQRSSLGLSVPVGLEQGRFRIVRQNGKILAINGYGNAGLFSGMQTQLQAGRLVLSKASSDIVRQNRQTLGADELSRLIRELREKK